MHTDLFTTADLRWAQNQVRIPEMVFQQFVLAAMMSVRLRETPMTMVGREHGVKREYPIVGFEVHANVREEFRREPYAHYMVVPVIDQPHLKASTIAIRQHMADVVTVVLNRGYEELPEEPTVKETGEPEVRAWEKLGSGRTHIDLEWSPQAWQELVHRQVALMRIWSEAFAWVSQAFKQFQPGDVVVWQYELQAERWPQVPLFKVVTQVEPFINKNAERGDYGTTGLVDTILVPQCLGHGRGPDPFYAKSEDVFTLAQYEARLLETPRQTYSYSVLEERHFEPSAFMLDEVLRKIPEEVRKGRF